MTPTEGKAPSESQAKAPRSAVHVDDEAKTVAIGATIDGVFVPFYTLPQSDVDGLVASAKARQEASAEPE